MPLHGQPERENGEQEHERLRLEIRRADDGTFAQEEKRRSKPRGDKPGQTIGNQRQKNGRQAESDELQVPHDAEPQARTFGAFDEEEIPGTQIIAPDAIESPLQGLRRKDVVLGEELLIRQPVESPDRRRDPDVHEQNQQAKGDSRFHHLQCPNRTSSCVSLGFLRAARSASSRYDPILQSSSVDRGYPRAKIEYRSDCFSRENFRVD